MKVSDRTWEQLEGYLIEGLDVFVGYEALIGQAVAAGAVGAVSALASAFPEIVAAAVRGEDVDPGALRAEVDGFPRHAALKHVLARRGVPIREDVRLPLRGLTEDERAGLDAGDRPRTPGRLTCCGARFSPPRTARRSAASSTGTGCGSVPPRFVAGETLDQVGPGAPRSERAGAADEHDDPGGARQEPGGGGAGHSGVRGDAPPDRRRAAPDEHLGQADASRRRHRRGARLREHRAAGHGGGAARQLRPDRHGGHAVRRPDAGDLPAAARRGARQRRDRPAVVPVPHARDLESLLPLQPNLRIVKGAYKEPAAIAHPKKEEVDAAYDRLVARSSERASFTAVATHDQRRIEKALALGAGPGADGAPDALRRAASAPARARPPRSPRAGRHPVRARLVPVPDAAAGRAARRISSSSLRSAAGASGCSM